MLKSADEAKKHLTSSSQEIAERLRKLSSNLGANGNKLGEVLGIMGKGFDDVHTQCHSTWAAVTNLGESSAVALNQIRETQKVLELQQADLAGLAKTAGDNEALAIEAKAEANTALRIAQGNLSHVQEAQLTASSYCLIFKGVPQKLTAGREKYREMMAAFEIVLEEMGLVGAFVPKSLRRMTKRRDDMSTRPPHLRVELASINHRVLIFDRLREMKEETGNPSFTIAPDIPRYALKRHNTLHKIAHVLREKESGSVLRVSMGQKWPVIQFRPASNEWANLPDNKFEAAKATYVERQRAEVDRKKAAKRQMAGGPMETDQIPIVPGAGPSKNPRLPSQSTPAATRANKARK